VIPDSLRAVAEMAVRCRNCPLWEHATQTVFGEGPDHASMVLVGEQPGDREDRIGRPFVGPAGRILDEALVVAEIDRASIYVTNAVKHFKFVERGKRRIHAKPGTVEIEACKPWLDQELEALDPCVLVLMGTTAVRSVLGPGRTISGLRGRVLEEGPAPATVVTTHPSAIVRMKDPERTAAFDAFVDDLRLASAAAG
jgi:uracil-DNA glycosylase family protein